MMPIVEKGKAECKGVPSDGVFNGENAEWTTYPSWATTEY